MVKIKVEKKMNLAELIQWAWQEKQRDEHYKSNLGKEVHFDIDCTVTSDPFLSEDDVFTVEIEEEITEETRVLFMLEVYSDYDDGDVDFHISKNESIADLCDSHSIAFYKLNPDQTTILLWTKEGGMVE